MGFSRQEFWSGLPFPPPGDLPDPGIKPTPPASPALADRFFTTEPPGKSQHSPEEKVKGRWIQALIDSKFSFLRKMEVTKEN